jgi:uncharacterized protein
MFWVWLYYVLLMMLLVFGLLLNIIGLPGLWLMLAFVAAYAWITGGVYLGGWTLLVLLSLVLAAEVVEFVAGAAGARQAGGSNRAMWAAVGGGIIGGIFLTFLVPIPVIGTVVGACAGSFLAAGATELYVRRNMLQSLDVAWGAAKGRFWGIVSKTGFGMVMLLVTGIMALPIGARPPGPVAPAPLAEPEPSEVVEPVETLRAAGYSAQALEFCLDIQMRGTDGGAVHYRAGGERKDELVSPADHRGAAGGSTGSADHLAAAPSGHVSGGA